MAALFRLSRTSGEFEAGHFTSDTLVAPVQGSAADNAAAIPHPHLLEEKLKLHARIIDEFNLVQLEKLPRAELMN